MKKIISLLLALCLVFTTFSVLAESKWTNASDWAVSELEDALKAGVYPAALENKDLTENITRAEQAALTVKIYESVTGKAVEPVKNPFADTTDEEIVKAYTLGITSGTTETTFSPEDNLTREQAAAMLARVYKKITGKETLEFEMPQQFADHESISDYAVESVYFMNAMGYIKGTNNGFEPQGLCAREAALAIAQRMANNLKKEEPVEPAEPEEKPEEKEVFTVACIGGSLTEGGGPWQYLLKGYLAEKMPDKEIKIVNSGIGGTTSEYGAKRYAKDVLAFNPDLVIIEFAVNDRTMGTSDRSRHQIYMESMVQQSLRAEKVPAVMFLYSNHAYEGTTLETLEFTKQAKKEVAAYYNIPEVDAHKFVHDMYEADTAKVSTTYKQWLEDEKKYYPVDNVHPYATGYELFGKAIVDAFEKEGLDKFLAPVQAKDELFSNAKKDIVMSSYNYMYVTDSRISYSGKWYLCNKENPRQNLTEGIATKFYEHPYYSEGGVYTTIADSTMTFKTDANEIFISYLSGSDSNEMVVLVNDKEVSTFATSSDYPNMNYVTKGVTGVKGKTITIKAKNYAPLRIFAIIERFN